MDLSNIEDLKAAVTLAGIRPKKGLGQHFLIDRPALETIMAAGEITKTDTILEVGPGLGVMTAPLSTKAGKVVAVETDQTLVELLKRDAPANLEVVTSDILEYDLRNLPGGYKVIANIPYYLTGKLIRTLLESSNPPALMSLLIQKEVAERITAKPGAMSILAVAVQYYTQPEVVGIVERHKFWPAPAVDSAILKLVARQTPVFPAEIDKLFRLVKAGFGEKRKQLKNSLAGGLNLDNETVVSVLDASNLAPTARAQELSMEQWGRLYNMVMQRQLI